MEWLDFAVVVGCGLVGFVMVNAFIDNRRAKAQQRKNEANGNARADRGGFRKDHGASEEDTPRTWWEVLNVDRNATAEQIKEAFRKEISKYHPDRVEGLGIELRELADRKAKEVTGAYAVAKTLRRFN
jgi:DnaJ-class molecular chaperone